MSMLLLDPRPIIQRVTKGSNRSSSNRFFHIETNQSLKFTPTSCTSTTNFNLVWDDFIDFYAIISSSEALESYSFLKYLILAYFLKYWDNYRRLDFTPCVNLDWMPPSCWRLGPRNKRLLWCLICFISDKMNYKNK
jgi:hypothetical protein